MKIKGVLGVAVFFMLLATVGIVGQEAKPTIYDGFNQRWLNPERWDALGGWISCWSRNLECVREIQNGRLRLATRTVGDRDSDYGNWMSKAELLFNHDLSSAITSIQSDITVRQFDGVACPANAFIPKTQVAVGGNFFNSGTGDPGDDVHGLLIIAVNTDSPKLMQVGTYWGWGAAHGYEGYWTFLGSYELGIPLVGSLTWDRINHQFVIRVWRKDDPRKVAQVAGSYGEYGVSDAYPPSDPTKALVVGTHVPNCTSVLSDSHGEALFDNVIVNQ